MLRRRLLVVALVLVVLFVPVPTPADLSAPLASQAADPTDAERLTWVATQGHWRGLGGGDLVAVDAETGERVWEHDRYNHYYDVDPLNESHVLVVAGGVWTGQWAIEMDWREDRVVHRVRVPWDTHDVDALPSGDWVVADKDRSRVFEVDPNTGAVGWEYRFADHYDRDTNGVAGDFTHLNDVDAVQNGSAYLLSPRNFDRVLVVDRATKETEWVLGAQGDHETLARQHNPTLLQTTAEGGPTVLVADSENDRVIEYHRTETGDWQATWSYAGNLSWPRDADRLPNGNTLIVDSGGQRVLEVTPNGTVVWERDQRLHPYDAERQALGDEPRGPTLTGGTVAPATSDGDESDSLAFLAWVPPRPTLALLLSLGWVVVELRRVAGRLRRLAR